MPYTTVRAATVRAESLKMMSPFTPTPSLADPQEFTDPDAPVATAPTPAGAIHAAEGLCDVGARLLDESDDVERCTALARCIFECARAESALRGHAPS